MRTGTLLLVLAVIGACVERGPLSPSDDLDIGNRYDSCRIPCENFRRFRCAEGEHSIDGHSCETNCASALRPLPLKCWAQAETVTEAKSCGSLRCVQ